MRRSHRLAVLVLPLLVLAALAVLLVAVGGNLPDPVAIHFGADGQADGFGSTTGLWATFVGFPLAMWALFATVTRVAGEHVIGARALAALPLGIVSFFLGIALTTLLPQVGVADAATVDLAGWAVPASVVIALAGGLVGAWAAGPTAPPPSATGAPPADAVRADLDADVTIWRGETPTSPPLRGLAVVTALVGIGMWWLVDVGGALIMFLVTVVVVASSRYDVTVGPGGVVVRGALGWPRTTVPARSIAKAGATDLKPYDYGGWGWRVRGHTTAVLTRSGPALLIERADGAELAVSLDRPEEAAGIVNALLDRRQEAPGAADARS